jgi:hypothetical protein
VPSNSRQQVWSSVCFWWREQSRERGAIATSLTLFGILLEFVRDSTPQRRRQRYGDMEYDWEHRVDTTSGTVGWKDRLLGLFHSPYQPTDPEAFREMMANLPIRLEPFTFIDLGSGKGRTLMMASDYPFRRIVGVEFLPALHRIAKENLARYSSPRQRCRTVEALCCDAEQFAFPPEPLVVYLFNPLPESGLRQVVANLDRSVSDHPRPVYLLYHNPVLDRVLGESRFLIKLSATPSYSIYVATRG